MQQAVLRHFPDIKATYRFTNRNSTALFSRQCIERFQTAVSSLLFHSLYICVIPIDHFCNKTSPVCLWQKPNCNGWSAPALIWHQHILHTYPHIGTNPSRQRSNTYPSPVISWEDMSRSKYLALGRKLFSGKCPWWPASASHISKSSS